MSAGLFRLFGKPLFPGKSHNEVLAMNASCEFQFVEVETLGNFATATLDLLMKMLDLNPATRITAEEALTHPFFGQSNIFKPPIRPLAVHQEDSVMEMGSCSPIRRNNSPLAKSDSLERFRKYRNKMPAPKQPPPQLQTPAIDH